MSNKPYFKIFNSHDEAELFDLKMDAALSPTEKFYQGRELVEHAYAWSDNEYPDFEPIIRIMELKDGEAEEIEIRARIS